MVWGSSSVYERLDTKKLLGFHAVTNKIKLLVSLNLR